MPPVGKGRLLLSRNPHPALKPLVETVWATQPSALPCGAGPARELVLPTGQLHLVLRLEELPLRSFASLEDPVGTTQGTAVIGGARAAPYLRDVSRPVASVGALLRPGAGRLLLSQPAAEFSHAHAPLEAAWGPVAVAEARERLAEAPSLAGRLDLFEALLLARLRRCEARYFGIDPRIAAALSGLQAGRSVAGLAEEAGHSSRYFTTLFRREVGLTPKTFARLLRFGRALDRLGREPGIAWAELAAAEGYADQAHFSREFRDFAGLSPGAYRRASPSAGRHVPV